MFLPDDPAGKWAVCWNERVAAWEYGAWGDDILLQTRGEKRATWGARFDDGDKAAEMCRALNGANFVPE